MSFGEYDSFSMVSSYALISFFSSTQPIHLVFYYSKSISYCVKSKPINITIIQYEEVATIKEYVSGKVRMRTASQAVKEIMAHDFDFPINEH